MTRLFLVRHGRAAAGWDDDADPGLDDIGRRQATRVAARLAPAGPLDIWTSPLRRCRETASPLAATWGTAPIVQNAVAEIPSPEGIEMGARVPWLRAAMAGRWGELGERYTSFRDGAAAQMLTATRDTVVFSLFVAINAVIGAALGDDRLVIRSLDNCSVTIIDITDGRLVLVEGGEEADTLIR
ncbi:MAG TPA: histidine phosphatase family protein [Actinomycetota bacterium]